MKKFIFIVSIAIFLYFFLNGYIFAQEETKTFKIPNTFNDLKNIFKKIFIPIFEFLKGVLQKILYFFEKIFEKIKILLKETETNKNWKEKIIITKKYILEKTRSIVNFFSEENKPKEQK